ncbi:hypothetical protein CROQUDRAFT_714840 [Cronartium quercuum f. sp. fusiforme G11]|uniref:ARM repeat superfamily protein n=1 Tax=Cronartium quercuum f. sp. fusiforme G11 TaxID=708437 RepID=A0A9P6TCW9_9BASI|nr:hypothetical protein CROQUDRAFT_714840 [Cronartium quercuum f. sp. fusiforme G11]
MESIQAQIGEPQNLIELLNQLINPQTSTQIRNQLDSKLSNQLIIDQPQLTLTELTQLSIQNIHPVQLRIQSLILLRTLAFKQSSTTQLSPWSTISTSTQDQILQSLLHSLLNQPSNPDQSALLIHLGHTISHFASQLFFQHQLWPDLQNVILQPPSTASAPIRAQILSIYAASPELLADPPTNFMGLGPVLLDCLSDDQPIELRISALSATTATLRHVTEVEQESISEPTDSFYPILDALTARIHHAIVIPLHNRQLSNQSPRFVRIALGGLADFLRILPVTHLISRTRPQEWLNPLAGLASDRTLPDDTRSNVLECLLIFVESSLEDSNQNHQQNPERWSALIDLLLSIMSEVEEPNHSWLLAEEDEEDEDTSLWVIAEENLDRLANLLGPVPILLLPLLRNHTSNWREKHSILSAIGAIAEACGPLIKTRLQTILEIVLDGLQDNHPRVIHASIYALAQLCSSLQSSIQINHSIILEHLTNNTFGSNQPARIRAFAGMCVVNYLSGLPPRSTLDLSTAVKLAQKLITLISSQNPTSVRKSGLDALARLFGYLDEQVAEVVYEAVGNTLENVAEEMQKRELDRETVEIEDKLFNAVVQLAIAREDKTVEDQACLLATNLINAINRRTEEKTELLSTFSQLSRAISQETFTKKGYLSWLVQSLMPSVVLKPDVSASGLLDDDHQYDDGWQSVVVGGQSFGIRTSELEEKAGALDALVVLAERMGSWIVPYCEQIVEAVLPLLRFYFSDEVRDAAVALLPIMLRAAQESQMSTDQLQNICQTFLQALTEVLSTEQARSILCTSLCSAWADSYTLVPVPSMADSFIETCSDLMTRLESRSNPTGDEDEDEDDEEELVALLTAMSRGLRLLMPVNTSPGSWNKILHLIQCYAYAIPRSGITSNEVINVGFRRWAFRLVAGFVKGTSDGQKCWEEVLSHVADEIGRAFDDEDTCVRGIAPFIIGLCAEHPASNSVYSDLIKCHLRSLVEGLQKSSENEEDLSIGEFELTAVKVARENCVSALAKIIRNPIEGIGADDLERILDLWVSALPIEVDVEEIEPTYGLLLELIAREHRSIDPNRSEQVIEKVVGALLSPLGNPSVPSGFKAPLLIGLKTYLGRVNGSIEERQGILWDQVQSLLSFS